MPASPRPPTALVVCGALARELVALRAKHGWEADILAIPARLHNTPDAIPAAVQKRVEAGGYRHVVVVYGDCGTAGALDQTLAQMRASHAGRVLDQRVERVAGPHCYEMYAGGQFDPLMAEAPGTFFLTDFLVRSFEALVLRNLGLDRFPELREDYFGNYTRCVYLAQTDDPALRAKAEWAAGQLGLPLEVRPVGYGALEARLLALLT